MTEDLRTVACPDAEQLAEYVEGRLTAEDCARVEAHLADCEMCREVVASVVRDQEAPVSTVMPFWRRPKVLGGALALAASLVVVAQLQPQWNPFRRPTAYEELVAAVGTNRTVEGRLPGGFQYGPFRSPMRGQNRVDYGVLAAVARIRESASQSSTSSNAHALGVSHIIQSEFDEAIAVLKAATARPDGQRSDIYTDLSVAYLARAGIRQSPDDVDLGRQAAARALELNPENIEARFNHALSLESLNLKDAARNAWRQYLELDSSSPWADEVRERLKALN